MQQPRSIYRFFSEAGSFAQRCSFFAKRQ